MSFSLLSLQYKYSDSFSFEDGTYKLDEDYEMIWDMGDENERNKVSGAHYTCLNKSGECSSLYYVYYFWNEPFSSGGNAWQMYYYRLDDGEDINQLLSKMRENINDSDAKSKIDSWYEDNILGTNDEGLLEDTVFCGDRTIVSGGLLFPGGQVGQGTIFSATERLRKSDKIEPSLECHNNNDAYTVNPDIGNGALRYPVGLLMADEMVFAGYGNSYLGGVTTWSMSASFYARDVSMYTVWTTHSNGATAIQRFMVRPVVSIVPGAVIAGGDGSATSPWELEK